MPNIAKISSLLCDESRAKMLKALMDGRFHPASELAYMAQIKPQTASFHLQKLLNANIVKREKHGRHMYYGLAGSDVSEVIEQIMAIAPETEIKSFKAATDNEAIRNARTCYDHLAGRLGVEITTSLERENLLLRDEKEFTVTEKGASFLHDFGIALDDVKRKRRKFSSACLDWSERKHHLGGAVGNALLTRLLTLGWIERHRTSRAVIVTPTGRQGLLEKFRIDW